MNPEEILQEKMIDLVFVLTNKLEVSVKEIRKTVHDNQQENLEKFDELNSTLTSQLDIKAKEIEVLRQQISRFENQISDLYSEQEKVKNFGNNLQGIFFFMNFFLSSTL